MEKLTDECLIKNMEIIKNAFPALSIEFLEILKERFKASGFNDARINNAVKGVVDTCRTIPTIAHFILFDKENPVRKMEDGVWYNRGEDGVYRNKDGNRLN